MKPSPERSRTGTKPPATMLAFAAVIVVGGLIAWQLLGDSGHPTISPTNPPMVAPDDGAAPLPLEGAIVAPHPTAQIDEDKKFKGSMKQAATLKVRNPKTGEVEFKAQHSLNGRVISDRDETPIYAFKVWLIPESYGAPETAKNNVSPNTMRNGVLHLDGQFEGKYHMVVESREHEAVTRFIELPYDGELVVRLKYGTCIRGVVRDSFLQPVPNVDVELSFDVARLDPGVTPPMQRLAKSDANGRYFFYKLPGGTYSVSAKLFGDALASEPEFRLDPGNEVTRDFMIGHLGTLRVVISNPIDQPLARAKTTLYSKLDDGRDRVVRSSLSDLKGVARLEFVREGSYKLKISVQGFVPHEETVVVAAGDTSRDISVRLEIAPKSGG